MVHILDRWSQSIALSLRFNSLWLNKIIQNKASALYSQWLCFFNNVILKVLQIASIVKIGVKQHNQVNVIRSIGQVWSSNNYEILAIKSECNILTTLSENMELALTLFVFGIVLVLYFQCFQIQLRRHQQQDMAAGLTRLVKDGDTTSRSNFRLNNWTSVSNTKICKTVPGTKFCGRLCSPQSYFFGLLG